MSASPAMRARGAGSSAASAAASDQRAAAGAASWRRRFRVASVLVDALMVTVALVATHLLAFGTEPLVLDGLGGVVTYDAVLVVIWAVWVGGILLTSKDAGHHLTRRPMEGHASVVYATVRVFGAIAIASYLLHIHLSRLFFLIALPLGIALLVAGRLACDAVMIARRRRGVAVDRAIVVGTSGPVARAVEEIRAHPSAGLEVVTVCLLDDPTALPPSLVGVPRVTGRHLIEEAGRPGIGAVIATSGVGQKRMRRLTWALEDLDVELLVVPDLLDVSRPRIHTASLPGVTMLRIDTTRLTPVQELLRRAFDIAFSSLVLALLAPVFLVIAVAIKRDSPGPAIFRQERIGLDGRPFTIHKFRTMVANAEDLKADLVARAGGRSQLFKMKDDPRITKLGAFLRRTSLDELPQFWTVLRGPMSVVGPRPQVADEVAEYDDAMHRRLLIKPGITGPWQVNGRNSLSLEESIRLDLAYVENWSLANDIAIIFKTVLVMFKGDGV